MLPFSLGCSGAALLQPELQPKLVEEGEESLEEREEEEKYDDAACLKPEAGASVACL